MYRDIHFYLMCEMHFREFKDSINILCRITNQDGQNYIDPNTWDLLLNVRF